MKHIKYNKSIKINGLLLVAVAMAYGIFAIPQSSMAQLDSVDNVPEKQSLVFDISMNYALVYKKATGQQFIDEKALEDFYEGRDNRALWMTNRGMTPAGTMLFERIANSWTHGLNPETYHYSKLRSIYEQPNFLRMAQMELLLTDAFMRYACDLSGMRVDVSSMQTDAQYWRERMPPAETLGYLIGGGDFTKILETVEPQSKTYKKLREELIKLTAERQKNDYDDILPIEIDYMLRPGERHKKVPDLRLRLGTEAQTSDIYRYDDRMVAAVRRFQRENHLDDDGIVGSRTLQLLNRTQQDKIYQLIANMERLRWAPVEQPAKFIVVNIPSAKLWAIKNDAVALEMPVIVGNPGRKTRSFISHAEGVRFNPTWTIPATIKRFDIWPKVKQDANYLNEKGIRLLKGYGSDARVIDPLSVNWNGISWAEVQKMRMVQAPGETNPLGRVRVLMPNIYNIYLHDTNHPEYFERTERALSSGCMRMKEPKKVAQFIMDGNPGWYSAKMNELLSTGKLADVPSQERIPVYVYYYTNWIDGQGQVVYGSDVYKNDRKLISLLRDENGIYIPGQNRVKSTESAKMEVLASSQ